LKTFIDKLPINSVISLNHCYYILIIDYIDKWRRYSVVIWNTKRSSRAFSLVNAHKRWRTS